MLEDAEVAGAEVHVGDMVLLGLGSANRDPEHFPDAPERVDITRVNAREAISFGAGPHFCLGSALARREAALAIGALFERFPGLELSGEATWKPRVIFRALDTLPVSSGR